MIIIKNLEGFIKGVEQDSGHGFQVVAEGDKLEIHIFESISKYNHARILSLVDSYDEDSATYSISLLRSTEMHLACKHRSGRWSVKGIDIPDSVRDSMEAIIFADPALLSLLAEAGGKEPWMSLNHVYIPQVLQQAS